MVSMVQHAFFSMLVLVLLCRGPQVVSAARFSGSEGEEESNETATHSPLTSWTSNSSHSAGHVVRAWRIILEAVTGYTESGEPMPRLPKRKLQVLLFVAIVMLIVTSTAVAGIRTAMSPNKSCRWRRRCDGVVCWSSISATAVLEARHEILRGMIDSALLHSAELEGPVKVLSGLFNVLMERILQLSRQGLLGEEVMLVLDSALESHDLLKPGQTHERRQLVLDLISAGVLHSADHISQQAAVLTELNDITQQKIRDLAVYNVVSEKVLLDLESARETDSLLRRRLNDMTISKAASFEGCLDALTSTK
eukprot:CAMPEP_0197655380 /NCGR_PEP_ID=MMETSP1338-20131121/39417_1 /TAXON_ID=43686 ORGANISM="Pelagodinium beii, Strain RCC1491" /NCGR_SAMPLE_ID=MMETSP1338 /ASSEMBLY_ACC=CAM_ASM_000754 /LENGTH=307 /DNA_ID=CAMNT_0043231015 /DNA_START=47 /DNA_END=970 /DNA_ORIENTATION=+